MTVRVSVGYGLTVGRADGVFGSQNFKASIDIEDEMSQEAADTLVATLAQKVKLAVINEAGLTAATDPNGVVFPVFPSLPAVVTQQVATVTPIFPEGSADQDGLPADHFNNYGTDAYQNPAPAVPAISTGQGQGGGGGGPQPGVEMTWDGRPVKVYDNRAKIASGEHKPNAAPFKLKFLDVGDQAPDDVKYKSVWVKNQNGSINQAGLALQQAVDAALAGVTG